MTRRTLRLNHVARILALIERMPPDDRAQLLEVLRRATAGVPLADALEQVTGDREVPAAWTDQT